MLMQDFIKQYKVELDEAIYKMVPHYYPLNDGDRVQWILNYRLLYNWAVNNGLRHDGNKDIYDTK
jgi:hypothetical protein